MCGTHTLRARPPAPPLSSPPPAAAAPDFSSAPMKKLVQAQVGSEVALDCRPRASPRARSSWKRGEETVRDNGRYSPRPPRETCRPRTAPGRPFQLFGQQPGFAGGSTGTAWGGQGERGAPSTSPGVGGSSLAPREQELGRAQVQAAPRGLGAAGSPPAGEVPAGRRRVPPRAAGPALLPGPRWLGLTVAAGLPTPFPTRFP